MQVAFDKSTPIPAFSLLLPLEKKDNMNTNEVVKTSEIKIRVGLDANNVPIEIDWAASDMHAPDTFESCKALAIALFDRERRDTLRIDLWTKEMQVMEMDRFMYQLLKSLGDSYYKATQNKEMASQMASFAQYFGEKTEIIPPVS